MPNQPKTILLVEDDEFIRTLCYNTLAADRELAGVHIETAQTGNEAVEKLVALRHALNLVLLDIVLPDKNGYEILEYMRNNNLGTIPVVVLSNLGQEEEVRKAKELGARDFMIKAQSDMSDIAATVKKYLA